MARYIDLDEKKIKQLKREAQYFQDDIVCAIGTDFMHNIAEAENKMIFDILKGLEDEPTADVVPKSEVEELKEDNARLKDDNEYLQDKVFKVRLDVAREIFEEIENIIQNSKYNQATPYGTEERYNPYVIIKQIAELKKKYTEGENG